MYNMVGLCSSLLRDWDIIWGIFTRFSWKIWICVCSRSIDWIFKCSQIQITTLCVTISLSAYVTLICLYSPKLYIIILHPEKNVRWLFSSWLSSPPWSSPWSSPWSVQEVNNEHSEATNSSSCCDAFDGSNHRWRNTMQRLWYLLNQHDFIIICINLLIIVLLLIFPFQRDPWSQLISQERPFITTASRQSWRVLR